MQRGRDGMRVRLFALLVLALYFSQASAKREEKDREKTARRRKGARKRKKEVEKKGWQANQGSS